MGSLVYADIRSLLNTIAEIRRKPSRLFLWLLYLISIGGLLWARTLPNARGMYGGNTSDVFRADYLFCATLAFGGLILLIGNAGSAFRHRAEARYLIRAPIAAPLVIAYLQARSSLSLSYRLLATSAYFLIFLLPGDIGATTVSLDIVALTDISACFLVALFPRRYAPAPIARLLAGIGASAIVISCACAGQDLLAQFVPATLASPLIAHLPEVHPGHVLLVPVLAATCIVVCALCAALATAAFTTYARDIFPELYASSLRHVDAAERIRSGDIPSAFPEKLPAQRHIERGTRVPGGAWVLLWKSWIPYRSRATYLRVLRGYTFLAITGYAAGAMSSFSLTHFRGAVLATAFVSLAMSGATTGAEMLAVELQRPLFHLSTPSLFERIAVLAFADIWRRSLWTAAAATAAIAGGLSTPIGIAIIVVAPCMYFLFSATGYAIFSFFPRSVDLKGPLGFLRYLILWTLFAPVYALLVVGTSISHIVPFAMACVAIALAEAGLLIGIASWRLDGRVDILRAA